VTSLADCYNVEYQSLLSTGYVKLGAVQGKKKLLLTSEMRIFLGLTAVLLIVTLVSWWCWEQYQDWKETQLEDWEDDMV
jgi:hypothetical protein